MSALREKDSFLTALLSAGIEMEEGMQHLMEQSADDPLLCDPPFTNPSDFPIGAPDSQIGRYD
jgi:hypothetical protein